jgi:hypothetical protein
LVIELLLLLFNFFYLDVKIVECSFDVDLLLCNFLGRLGRRGDIDIGILSLGDKLLLILLGVVRRFTKHILDK